MNAKTRHPAGQVISGALEELIRKEIVSGIKDIFRQQFPDKDGQGGIARRHGGGGNNGDFFPQQRPFDRKQMEAMIDELVASSLVHGRQTSKILRALFGLVPSLIGR